MASPAPLDDAAPQPPDAEARAARLRDAKVRAAARREDAERRAREDDDARRADLARIAARPDPWDDADAPPPPPPAAERDAPGTPEKLEGEEDVASRVTSANWRRSRYHRANLRWWRAEEAEDAKDDDDDDDDATTTTRRGAWRPATRVYHVPAIARDASPIASPEKTRAPVADARPRASVRRSTAADIAAAAAKAKAATKKKPSPPPPPPPPPPRTPAARPDARAAAAAVVAACGRAGKGGVPKTLGMAVCGACGVRAYSGSARDRERARAVDEKGA